MSKYQTGKAAARARAIEYQNSWDTAPVSYEWIANMQSQLEKLARKYGLVKEFRENGII